VIDVSELDGLVDPGNSPVITPTLLLKWEEAKGRIIAGDISHLPPSRWKPRFPGPDLDCLPEQHREGLSPLRR